MPLWCRWDDIDATTMSLAPWRWRLTPGITDASEAAAG
jgi:hypothetical protein